MARITDWRAWLLAVAAALIWIAHFDRWTIASWQIPTDYYGDAHETLARLKAASEGDVWPTQSQVMSRLGAPFGANWNAYPAPDKPLMLLLGGLARVVGLYASANLGFLLAQVTATLAFYFTARWMRCRWEWAAAGALLFAFTYHTFHRGLAHYSLVFTWTVPLGLLTVWLVAGSQRLTWARPGAVLCVLTGAVLGALNPYNLFFWLQLMGWALVWQWLRERRPANLQIGAAAIAASLLVFAAVNAETWLHLENPDAIPLLARNYGGTEIYALKVVEMFIPPPFHHWGGLAFFGERYARWSAWRGEVFLPYLGLAGIAGLVWLVAVSVRRFVAGRAPPGQALSLGWIVAYSAVGGLTKVLALFVGFQIFRATNRAAVFISAIVLFFLVGRLSRVSRGWPAWLRVGTACALAAIGVFEQLPKPDKPHEVAALTAEFRDDEQFGRALEDALPGGAMVFQLPVLEFPEGQPPHQLGDYEHFRPYLATERLRFSFGAPKSRARGRWQSETENLPAADMVRRLEQHGFAALYLNRRGFADGGEKLLEELAALGYTQRLESPAKTQVAVLLKPAPTTAPPLAESMTFGKGWHLRPDDGWRWAFDDEAALSYHNPYPEPIVVDLQLTLAGATLREVLLERDGEPLREFKATANPAEFTLTKLELKPGVNRFKLHSSEPPVRLNAGRNQLRSFGVRRAVVRVNAERLIVDKKRERVGTSAAPIQGAAVSVAPPTAFKR